MSLPVESVIPDILAAIESGRDVVLEAPPGAGKTTLVPLALAESTALGHGKIIVLEPRRIAARSAAHRMASLLGEDVGRTVGYRMRLESAVSEYTKIEVITEGILTRMLQDDPSLEGIGAILFDEFHERSMDADMALALSIKGRSLFREHEVLPLVVMSATLDTSGVADLLHDPAVIRTEGRQFPVDVVYGAAASPRERIDDRVVQTVGRALADNPDSSVLVFLPGQGEISRIRERLEPAPGVDVFELYGNLSMEAQRQAIAPSPEGRRKVVLSTNIAETSLTIEGVDVVVDAGLVREPVFDPATAMTRLQTAKISAASSVQRMGRAGRLRPGRCYRLWSASQQDQLAPRARAEILSADLAPLALALLHWGVSDPGELKWMDAPPAGAWQQAVALLEDLEAIERDTVPLQLTDVGRDMAELPMHPRLAHMLLRAAQIGEGQTAALLAAFLSERDPIDDNPDISQRLELLRGERNCPPRQRGWLHRAKRLSEQFESRLRSLSVTRMAVKLDADTVPGFLLACAYPDRVARQRHSGGYQLANGRSANFAGASRLAKHRWLSVAEVTGSRGKKGDVIRTAAALDTSLFDTLLAGLRREVTVCDWDRKSGRFVAEAREVVGALTLSKSALEPVPLAAKERMLIDHIRESGLKALAPDQAFRQWQARVLLARGVLDVPDVSDDALLASLEHWLSPYLAPISRLDDLRKLNLKQLLADRLTYEQRQQIEKLAPERLQVPSGSEIRIDYETSPPALAVKLQEMFGCDEAPSVLNGAVMLQIHLLSPAGRPLQVTQDLAHFWRHGYESVRKEMKGRYPKHPWPDDPTAAEPTRYTKHRQS